MEQAMDGSAQAGAPDGAQSDAGVGSSASGGQSPWAGLQDEGARTWVEKKGYKSVDDLAKAAHSLEGRLGQSLTLPGADAKPDEWDKFYARAGRPEKPEGYEFKRPEGLPPELPYDEGLAAKAKGWSHAAGLNPRQAQVLHDSFAKHQAELATAHVAKIAKAVEDTHASLVKEWGPENSEAFKTKAELANRAIKKLGLVDSFKQAGIILPKGELTEPSLAKAFALIGESMFAEDKLDGPASAGDGPNPFKAPQNVTEISRLVKNDPDRARALAKAAGVNPDHWLPKRK